MSHAQLVESRRSRRVKTYRFSPGRLERLTLTVWTIPKSDGVIKARLTGKAYVACGLGNEHYPEVEIVAVGHPRNPETEALVGALAGDAVDATSLAEELEGHALEDWFDPCEAEGFGEETTDIYGEDLE